MSGEASHNTPRRFAFRRSDRLTSSREFDAVFKAQASKVSGPLIVRTRANELGRHRLGMVVSRKVGNAVTRNRIKRRLREAFRLSRENWPGSYDMVVIVRQHELRSLDWYGETLGSAITQLDRLWKKRQRKSEDAEIDSTDS